VPLQAMQSQSTRLLTSASLSCAVLVDNSFRSVQAIKIDKEMNPQNEAPFISPQLLPKKNCVYAETGVDLLN
jgi:hypothetical protein